MQFCAEPSCGVLVQSGRCAVHRGIVKRAYDDRHGSRHARGYGNRWARRAAAFRQRYPLCGMRAEALAPVGSRCHDEQRTTLAVAVDHVVPHRGDMVAFWNERNWQSLCAACHMRKTASGR
jgi:5-methylcytosine-specific restriction protein A